MTKQPKKKGFTLVELIVVLVILAILAAILVPSLLGYIDQAKSKDIILEARYAYMDAQVALTEFYGQDTELFKAYYNCKTTSGYKDENGVFHRACVITHQTLGTTQSRYRQGGNQKVLDYIAEVKANNQIFSYGAYKTAYLVLKQMNALDPKNSDYIFCAVDRASETTYDEYYEKNKDKLKNCNPDIYQLFFDEKGRVLMLEYGKDGYLVRYQYGADPYVEKNGKTYKSY